MFEQKYGSDADGQVADRRQQALDGIPIPFAAIKRIADSADAGQESGS